MKIEPVAWTTQLALDCSRKVETIGFEVSGVNLWGERGVPLYPKSVIEALERQLELLEVERDAALAQLDEERSGGYDDRDSRR